VLPYFCITSFSRKNKMEKYCQLAYEAYRQDVKENYLSYDQFKKALCKPSIPAWVLLAGGAAVGYSLKK
jgi:hypothetical protein